MKGCQKKVIFIKNTGSKIFDEAYFIISREFEDSSECEENMVSEANRIIERSIGDGEQRLKKTFIKPWMRIAFSFALGAFASFVLGAVIRLI